MVPVRVYSAQIRLVEIGHFLVQRDDIGIRGIGCIEVHDHFLYKLHFLFLDSNIEGIFHFFYLLFPLLRMPRMAFPYA